MIRIWTLVILIAFSSPAFAGKRSLRFDSGRSGVGAVLGKPASFRYNYWLNWKRSLFFDVGYNWEQVVMATVSYSFYFYDVKDLWRVKNQTNALLFYLSPGVFTGYNLGTTDPGQTIYLGLRAVGGIEYLFAGLPLALRAEVGPAVYALGKTIGGVQGGVGLTYYLGSTKDSAGKEEFLDSDKSEDSSDEFGDELGSSSSPLKKPSTDELDLESELEAEPSSVKSQGLKGGATKGSIAKPSASKTQTKVVKPAPKKTKSGTKSKQEDLSEFE